MVSVTSLIGEDLVIGLVWGEDFEMGLVEDEDLDNRVTQCKVLVMGWYGEKT